MDYLGSCISPTLIKNPDKVSTDRFITVPCGRCHRCRKRRAAQWAFRLDRELRDACPGTSYFITLTYDDENVPFFDGNLSLWLPDWQNFWKRLRERNGSAIPIKYYGCGEYGGRTGRPHWHAIAFNIFRSEDIRKAWPLGHVHLDVVNMATISYVTGYIMKPPTKAIEELTNIGKIERTRSFMSKGLGKSYLTDAVKKYHNERLDECYVTQVGGRKISMPRYYRERIYPEEALRILRIRLKRASKEHAAKLLADFQKKYPLSDFTSYQDELRGQEIRYAQNLMKSKRKKC